MLRNQGSIHFLQVISAQILVILDIRVNIVAVQIFRQVDKILDAAGMVAHVHRSAEFIVVVLHHIIQLGGKVVQLVQIGILAQLIIEAVHIAVVVRNEPFFIHAAEIVCFTDSDALKDSLHFFRGGGKLDPFAHKLALVVFAQVGYKGGKGIVLVILIFGHGIPPYS